MKIILALTLLTLQSIVNATESEQPKPKINIFSKWLHDTFGVGRKSEEPYFNKERPNSNYYGSGSTLHLDSNGNFISSDEYWEDNRITPLNTDDDGLRVGEPGTNYYQSPGFDVNFGDNQVRVTRKYYKNKKNKDLVHKEVPIKDLPEKAKKTIQDLINQQQASKIYYKEGNAFDEGSNKAKAYYLPQGRWEGTRNTLLTGAGIAAIATLGYGAYWAYNKWTAKPLQIIIKELKQLDKKITINIQKHGFSDKAIDAKRRFTEEQSNALNAFSNALKIAIDTLEPASKK